ncbi:RNA-binding S4 domain-containing protein [Anaerotignum propionicum]|uniref:RNA-binding S4 domain-containing protein n=1 Tax=Anaerotignum propionicum TaxID=28446 RepID=UPI00210AEF8F|nr:RNA-binding S4 domain-containing protein [Anaerotignum propionicum]MCQ4935394.1 RNA-binding S4 domain-containing protein [Anaerotignum propionicum]
MQEVGIQTEYIKLQQILKLAGIIGQGSDARALIAEGLVYVNGNQALERGKKIRPNDVVEVKGLGSVKVVMEG